MIDMKNELQLACNKEKRNIGFEWIAIVISLLLIVITNGFSLVVLLIAGLNLVASNKQMMILQSGLEGEKKVTSLLKHLPEEFTVINNLQIRDGDNRQSEIDSLIIGNGHLYIVEVKNHKGHISGDASNQTWNQDVQSRAGNVYSRSLKNPVKQSTRQMYILKDMLNQKGLNPFIKQVVVFANESAQLNVRNSRIPILNATEIISYIQNDVHNTNRRVRNEEQIIQQLITA